MAASDQQHVGLGDRCLRTQASEEQLANPASDQPHGYAAFAGEEPRRYVDGRGSQIGLCRLLGGDFVAHERLCLPAQQVRREHRSGEGRADRFGRLLLQLHQSQAHGRPDGDRILEKAGRDSLRVGGCGLQSPKRRIPDALPVGQRLPELVAQAGRRPHVQGARGLEYRETEVRDADDQTRRVRHRFQTVVRTDERYDDRPDRRRIHLVLRGRFLSAQLRLQGQVPGRGERPLRRFVEVPDQLQMGILPLGGPSLEHRQREVPAKSQVDRRTGPARQPRTHR